MSSIIVHLFINRVHLFNIDPIQSKREHILDDLLNDIIDEIGYQKKDMVFAEEEKRLLMQYEELIKGECEVSNQKSRIELIRKEIEEIVKKDMIFDFFACHILKIIVFEDKIQIHFDIFPVVEMDVIGSGIEQVISFKNENEI